MLKSQEHFIFINCWVKCQDLCPSFLFLEFVYRLPLRRLDIWAWSVWRQSYTWQDPFYLFTPPCVLTPRQGFAPWYDGVRVGGPGALQGSIIQPPQDEEELRWKEITESLADKDNSIIILKISLTKVSLSSETSSYCRHSGEIMEWFPIAFIIPPTNPTRRQVSHWSISNGFTQIFMFPRYLFPGHLFCIFPCYLFPFCVLDIFSGFSFLCSLIL